MNVIEALRTRRTVHQFEKRPVPRDVLEEMLELAVWVPNHHVTEPWRFLVVEGESLEVLAHHRYEAVLAKHAGKPEAESRAQKSRQEYLQVSHIIVVIQHLNPDSGRRDEDYASVNLATYNMMLVAWSHGVGTYWGTGPLTRWPGVRQFLKVADDERIVAYVRVGFPQVMPAQRRKPGLAKTHWLNDIK